MPQLLQLLDALPDSLRMRDVVTGEVWTVARMRLDYLAHRDDTGIEWVGRTHKSVRFIGARQRPGAKVLWLLAEVKG